MITDNEGMGRPFMADESCKEYQKVLQAHMLRLLPHGGLHGDLRPHTDVQLQEGQAQQGPQGERHHRQDLGGMVPWPQAPSGGQRPGGGGTVFCITQGNTSTELSKGVDDRGPLKDGSLLAKVFGKPYGDRGHISSQLVQALFVDGVHLVAQIRRNVRNCLMAMADKVMLRRRSPIETVNDALKNIRQVEHSRHRSFVDSIANLISGLVAYCFLPKEPSLRYETVKTDPLSLF